MTEAAAEVDIGLKSSLSLPRAVDTPSRNLGTLLMEVLEAGCRASMPGMQVAHIKHPWFCERMKVGGGGIGLDMDEAGARASIMLQATRQATDRLGTDDWTGFIV